MIYFRHPASGRVYGYESIEERDAFGDPGLVRLTPAEEQALFSPSVPFEAQRGGELAAFRELREGYLNRLTGIALAAQVEDDADTLAAALAMRRGLLDMTDAPAVVAATTLEGLQAALKAEYAALVALVPAKLRDEFRKVGA